MSDARISLVDHQSPAVISNPAVLYIESRGVEADVAPTYIVWYPEWGGADLRTSESYA
jgi:hypothetical protein